MRPGFVVVACLGVVLLPAAATPGCGRVGYDPLVEDAGRPVDAAPAEDATSDAAVVPPEAGADAADAADAAPSFDATPSGPDADAAICVTSTVVDYCNAIPPLPAPPVIDGILDCGPTLAPIAPVDWIGPAPLPPVPTDQPAALAVAWRPDGLYVYVTVTTPAAFPAEPADPVFYGAGVEIFVDDDGASANAPAYDAPGAIQLVVAAPPDATTTGQRAEGFRNGVDVGPWAATQFGAFPGPTGFVVEGFVVASDLGLPGWPLATGKTIGFDIAIDVSYTTASETGPQGHRVGQYFFHETTTLPADAAADAAAIGRPYADPRSFCAPTLSPM